MTAPATPRERLSRAEYDEARKAGYSEEEIRAEYDVEDGGLPSLGDQVQAADASRVDPNRLPAGETVGPVKAAAQSALNAGTFGLADEAVGAVGAVLDRKPGESAGDAYTRLRDQMRAQSQRGREQHPIASGVGTVAGALAVPTPGAVTALKALKPTTGLGRVAAGATIGAGAGALQGLGEGEGSFADQLRSVARGTAWGAGGGAVAGALPNLVAGGKKMVDAARRNPREALAVGRTAARLGSNRGPAVEDVGVLGRWLGKKIGQLNEEPPPRFTGLGQDVKVSDLAESYTPVRPRSSTRDAMMDAIERETREGLSTPRPQPMDAVEALGERAALEMPDRPIEPTLFDAPEGVSIPLVDRSGMGPQAEAGGARLRQLLDEEVVRADPLNEMRRPSSPFPSSGSVAPDPIRGSGRDIFRNDLADEASRLGGEPIPFPTSGTDPVLRGAPSRGPEQMIDPSGRSVDYRPQNLREALLMSRAERGVPLLDRATEEALLRATPEAQVASRLTGNPIADELQQLGVGPDEIERILNYTPDEYRAWVESMRRSQSGPTRSRLRADEERLGLPSVTPEPPRSRPDLGPEPSLEELLAQSLESPRPKGEGVAEMTPTQRNQARTNARRDANDKLWADRRTRWAEWSKANPAPAEMQPRLKLEREIRDLEKQVRSERSRKVKHVGFTERQLARRRAELNALKGETP